MFDLGWDLFGYAGYSPALAAMVIAFRGTDSHSLYNWAENMRYWRTDLHVPFPGSENALVHTGAAPAALGFTVLSLVGVRLGCPAVTQCSTSVF